MDRGNELHWTNSDPRGLGPALLSITPSTSGPSASEGSGTGLGEAGGEHPVVLSQGTEPGWDLSTNPQPCISCASGWHLWGKRTFKW